MIVKTIGVPLYKIDSKGKIRVWLGEVGLEGEQAFHRTTSGLRDGKKVTSDWKEVFGKNIGRSNETTPEQQAISEMESMAQSKKDKGYTENVDNVVEAKAATFKPMLADKYENRGVDFSRTVYCQPKLDGIRCIAKADGFYTRNGKQHLAVPHIEAQLAEFFKKYPNVVLDGELYNHTLKDDFDKLASLIRKSKPTEEDLAESAEKVQYHIYDAFFEDQPNDEFWTRLDAAMDMVLEFISDEELMSNNPAIRFVETVVAYDQDILDMHYGLWLEDGYEGQMIRYRDPYVNKRARHLLKRKEFVDEEFPVIRVEEGEGNWAGAVKRFVVQLPNGKISSPHPRGKMQVMRELWESGKTPDWAKVRYQNYTPDGVLRFPTVLDYGYGERED